MAIGMAIAVVGFGGMLWWLGLELELAKLKMATFIRS